MPISFNFTNLLTKGRYGIFSSLPKLNRVISTNTVSRYTTRLIPQLGDSARVVLPISLNRFDGDKIKREQYDAEIDTLLRFTDSQLKTGNITSVDVVSTGELQQLNWGVEKAREIEEYFLTTHHKMLSKQTSIHTWSNFIKQLGEQKYEENYKLIKSASSPGSNWHDLMLKTQEATKVTTDIETSLEYQRREYALILSTQNLYTNIAYMGNISLAWSYLYKLYDGLPVFTRITIDKTEKKANISTADANTTVNLVLSNVEQVLTNQNFPTKEKIKLANMVTSLVQAYAPNNESVDKKLQDTTEKDKTTFNQKGI